MPDEYQVKSTPVHEFIETSSPVHEYQGESNKPVVIQEAEPQESSGQLPGRRGGSAAFDTGGGSETKTSIAIGGTTPAPVTAMRTVLASQGTFLRPPKKEEEESPYYFDLDKGMREFSNDPF